MSPEIYVDGKLVANVPDSTGLHYAIDGSHLWLDLSGINAYNKKQIAVLAGPCVGGERIIGLTQTGKGVSCDPKRGDAKLPELEVLLHERPIRISYQDKPKRVWVDRSMATISLGYPSNRGYYETYPAVKRTYRNPYWVKSHGRR